MKKGIVIGLIFMLGIISGKAQNAQAVTGQIDDALNGIRPITTSVPFLNITPDARAAGLGDVGAATSPDVFSAYWNPAKLAFLKSKFGGAVSYNPWLKNLVGDMSLSHLTGYYRLRKEDVVGLSLTYFDLGSLTFTDINGATVQDFNPREFMVGATYSRQLGEGFSAGLQGKFVYSNLTGNFSNANDLSAKPGTTAGADIGFFWNRDLFIQGQKLNLALGTAITNIGAKISYSNSDRANFIPTNWRLGYGLTYEIDDYNKVVWATDVNKLLVPSPQLIYLQNRAGTGDSVLSDGRRLPLPGLYRAPDKSLISGMFGSFSDAPNGFREEMQEVMWSSGLEYWYNDMFAVRGGYFNEAYTKGNRKYFTMGFGVRYQVIGFDFAYLIPVAQNNPLAETLRFALQFNFEGKKQKPEESVTE